jgi:hypothetical protein
LAVDTATVFTNGIANMAIAAGSGVEAQAGNRNLDFLNLAVNLGNATSPSTSVVDAGFGGLNLAANLGGNANAAGGIFYNMLVLAGGSSTNPLGGYGNLALNLLGNRNDIEAFGGFVNAAVNLGNLFVFPNGSNTTIHVGDFLTGMPSNLSVGFNWQIPLITPACTGLCGNNVFVNNGLGSLAGAIAVIDQTVTRSGFGISINGVSLPASAAAVSATASSSTQKNLVTVNKTAMNLPNGAAPGSNGGSALTASVKNVPKAAAASVKGGASSTKGSSK